jgi:heat shock protein HslJ
MLRLWLCRCSVSCFVSRLMFGLAALGAAAAFVPNLPAQASEQFPFGSELMLDAAPMHGSRRVPTIEIEDDGSASIDLWCASLKAQATVADSAITIVPGAAAPAQCDPDREARDADLLTALTQVTGWRRSGQVIELTGATPLRFHLMTN